MADDVRQLIEHWGLSRKEIIEYAIGDLQRARDKNRPRTSNRHQYDAWTRTMVAVLEDCHEKA